MLLRLGGGQAYLKNSKLHIITGELKDKDEIINFIRKNNINSVIDATHPFARNISRNLNIACKEINSPLLVFERKSLVEKNSNFNYIDNLKDIKKKDLTNKNIH